MHSSQNALQTLLDAVVQEIAQAEVRLLKATSDWERARLVDTLADLKITQAEITDALTEGC